MQNLLILSSSTGGGHNMRAYALKYWWEKKGGLAKVSHPLESTFKLYKFGSELYNVIQKYCPRLHFLYFFFLEYANLHRKGFAILGAQNWINEVLSFNPRIVVGVHAHLNHGYFDLLRSKLKSPFKFFIYCGEMGDSIGFSRHWVNKNADGFFGPFSDTCDAAIKKGMPVKKTFLVEPLLRPAFYKRCNKSEIEFLLTKYGLSMEKPIFLLGTGANGVNRHIEILSALDLFQNDFQVVALCGNNVPIYERVLKVRDKYKFKILPLKLIDDHEMVIFLSICKFFYTRPGAGSTTEAVACGAPIIFDISGGLMPQEINNLNFWKSRVTKLIALKDPKKIKKFIIQSIPKLKVEIEDTPRKLINRLEEG